ncbi:MAG TPA: type II secretion system protein GspG [Pirellulales bacterium]|jgi:hypothetical protein
MLQKYSSRIARSLKSLPLPTKVNSADLVNERPQALQGPNRNYQKFVLLAHQRSGSSLAITSLREHPQMVVFSELFVPDRMLFHLEGYDNHSERLLALRDADPRKFLDEFVFSPYRDGIQAVGFKLFPDQIDRYPFRCVWKWLARNRDLKIIYLTRRNLLATYTSLLIAQKDNKYGIKDETQRSRTTVTIDPEECLAEFRKRTRYEAAVERNIQAHEVMRWFYEDMAATPQQHLKQAQEFLGVKVCDLKIKMIKQEVRPLTEVIENYDELREYFAGAEWDYLFEDQQGASGSVGKERSASVAPVPVGNWINASRGKKTVRAAGAGKFFNRPAVTAGAIAIGLLFVGLFLLQLFASKGAAKEQTVSVISEVATRIKTYVQTHRELPSALDSLAVQGGSPPRAIDGWSRPLDYSVVGPKTFVLISYGADGVPGGNGEGSDIVCKYQVVDGDILYVQ